MKKTIYTLSTILFLISASNAFSQCSNKTKVEWENYFKENLHELDPIEGLWNVDFDFKAYNGFSKLIRTDKKNEDIVIIKNGNNFTTCPVNENSSNDVIVISKTASSNLYKYQVKFFDDGVVVNSNIVLNNNALFKLNLNLTEQVKKTLEAERAYHGEAMYEEWICVKTSPNSNDYNNAIKQKSLKEAKSSGTGFAVSSNGLIITNHHVIKDAKSIKIKGINGDFTKNYNAKIILEDKNNDLALIQISDASFSSLGTIPYVISSSVRSDNARFVICIYAKFERLHYDIIR